MLKLIANIKGQLKARNSEKQRQAAAKVFSTYMLKKGMALLRDYPIRTS